MTIFDNNNEILQTGVSEFDIAKTFECGQCFRWNFDEGGAYTGVAYRRALTLRQENDAVYMSCSKQDFEDIWRSYFDLGRDYAKIRQKLSVSDFMQKAAAEGAGIRILRQEPWEALCSFIISQNNNIPRIKKIIETLCSTFGEKLQTEAADKQRAGTSYNKPQSAATLYTFPTPDKIATLTESDLAPLRCGYRAAYIIAAAKAVSCGETNLASLRAASCDDARRALTSIHGVGTKVTDCVMLFGLHKLDTFPVDVWIRKALSQYSSADIDPSAFSPYAGIAQQYIYQYMRTH